MLNREQAADVADQPVAARGLGTAKVALQVREDLVRRPAEGGMVSAVLPGRLGELRAGR